MEKKPSLHQPVDLSASPDARRLPEGQSMNEPPLSNGGHEHEDEALLQIAHVIRQMPDLEPAANLLPSIMAAVQIKKRPIWYRVYRWATARRSITFSPLKLAPVAIAFAILCVVSVFICVAAITTIFQAQKPDAIPVVFSMKLPTARSVAVIGSLTTAAACRELKKINGEALWTVTLLLLAGRYEYAFLVDGGRSVYLWRVKMMDLEIRTTSL
jgi:hypothetical protein